MPERREELTILVKIALPEGVHMTMERIEAAMRAGLRVDVARRLLSPSHGVQSVPEANDKARHTELRITGGEFLG